MRMEHVNDRERGAVLVHVAIGLIAFMAFSTFVVDYGVFWLSRRQAQNAADAGALAGAEDDCLVVHRVGGGGEAIGPGGEGCTEPHGAARRGVFP